MRISFALVLLTTCILLTAELLGFMPDEDKFSLDARTKISESLGIQFSLLAPEKDIKKIQKLIRFIVKRNSDILSAGVRLKSGLLMFQSNNHEDLWQGYKSDKSTSSHVVVPLFDNGRPWGNVELRFKELSGQTFYGFFDKSIFKLGAFILLIGFFVYLAFMLRTLRQLDPTTVIPERVNAAFDTLAEGVIIIDENEQILLTNRSFSEKIGRSSLSLLGVKASELKWKRISKRNSASELPWLSVLKTGNNSVGDQLKIKTANGETLKFAVNASPIEGEKDKPQGVLITLDDITKLEQRNTELQTIVSHLKETKDHVQQQNKELHYLATRDSMTGCLNRRSFSEQFEQLFNKARDEKLELCCVMVDLDHFKAVNDNYGHATGDVVIKMLADILKSNTRDHDLVARYGGEEFCLVFPGLSADKSMTVAERIRLRVKDESLKRFEGGPRVTASIGVASTLDKPQTPEALNNLADEALYVAKESGRNKVVRWQAKPVSNTQSMEEISQVEQVQDYQATPEPQDVASLQNRIHELENIATEISAELEYNKNYDPLTRLPNQILFYDRIKQSIERGVRHGQLVAVLVIDIEMFSKINSTMGRSAGDTLLKEFAQRLNVSLRKSDGISRLTVSRFAGDEFAILLTDLEKEEQATWAVKRLLDVINDPIEIGDDGIYLSCKVGISLYPTDARDVETLLNKAMTAKNYLKTHKTNLNYQFYDQHMHDLSIKHLQLDKEIRYAIKHDQWQLLYQPKFDMKQEKIVGSEALIRWKHPQRGLLSPFEFIDFAEEHGLIIPIGNWVINEACRQIKEWVDQGIHDCKVAVNLSSVQLMQPDIVSYIFNTLDKYKLPPRLFEVEITETTLMDNMQLAVDSLQRLNSRGINISIDDFGTGYSSLSYLKNLPVNNLKIDRTFIKDICDDDNDKKIVQTLITMAHSMGLIVIAEGVEENDQFALLEHYECDEIQGYLLSMPVPADELLEMLKNPYDHIDITQIDPTQFETTQRLVAES